MQLVVVFMCPCLTELKKLRMGSYEIYSFCDLLCLGQID